jgi:peptidoglycan/xylan/chitin deacetylase (PgdA/CDA1 family)
MRRTLGHLKTMRPASSSCWVVGIYEQVQRTTNTKRKTARLTEFASAEAARAAYDDRPNASRVLLRRRMSGEDNGAAATAATAAASSSAASSSSFFHHHQLISCSTASWDVDGLGVATCLWLLSSSSSTSPPPPQQPPPPDHNSDQEEVDEDEEVIEEELRMVVRDQLANGTLPFVPPQRSPLVQQSLKYAMKLVFGRPAVTHFGSAPYRYQSVCHFDVPPPTTTPAATTNEPQLPGAGDGSTTTKTTKYVALSLDDAPCRFDHRDCSMVIPVLNLLARYDAYATFMVVGQWCKTNTHHADLIALLQRGHELANHGMQDRSYEHDSPAQFGSAVDQCAAIIQQLYQQAFPTAADDDDESRLDEADDNHNGVVKMTTTASTALPPPPVPPWFRAPHGRYTAAMAAQLQQRSMQNVMCDTYASCPILQDGPAVATQLLATVQNGSIILLHMPEVHVRQWCWEALELLLAGLTDRGYRVVTISQLARLSAAVTGSGSSNSETGGDMGVPRHGE